VRHVRAVALAGKLLEQVEYEAHWGGYERLTKPFGGLRSAGFDDVGAVADEDENGNENENENENENDAGVQDRFVHAL
jgi:hypothetical protein